MIWEVAVFRKTARDTVAMSDDMLIHFSSNSSNQSDQSLPTKIAKLEARMVSKASSAPPAQQQQQPPPAPPQQQQQQPTWASVSSGAAAKFGGTEELAEPSSSSDSDYDVRLFKSSSIVMCVLLVLFLDG
jgi:tousled-like kinase